MEYGRQRRSCHLQDDARAEEILVLLEETRMERHPTISRRHHQQRNQYNRNHRFNQQISNTN